MQSDSYDVAILGLGPVGCLAAILLARAGLEVVGIERDEQVYTLPRAVNLDGEIVRALQPSGLAEALNDLLQPVRQGERAGFANSQREWLFGANSIAFGVNGWQPVNMFDQPEVESFLRETAIEHPNMTAHIGCEATAFSDEGNGVSLTFERSGQPESLRARYLLACDGAASFTRKRLGIGWHNLGYDHDWLVVDVVTKPGHTLGTTTMQVCDPDRISTYVCTKDPYRRWEFKLNEGETWEEMLKPEKIRSLIEDWTPPGTYEIRRAAMYQFHAATADTWRVGNVFIAGDAAHQTPPFLGQGMNAGMRDVINIGWKLPMVIRGVAGDGLLDTYQAERDAHAHDLVEWAVSIGRLMEHLAAVEAAERAGEPPPEIPPELRSSGYGQGREQPPLRAGAIMTEQLSETGPVGYLCPQPMIRREDAAATDDATCRMDDLLGPGFSIIGRTGADLELSSRSRAIVEQLDARLVSLEGLTAVQGHFDRSFEQPGAMIVRPDRIVFGRTNDAYDLEALLVELAARLHLT